jgi:hypothetical protein
VGRVFSAGKLSSYREGTQISRVRNGLLAEVVFHSPEHLRISWGVLCGPLQVSGDSAGKVARGSSGAEGRMIFSSSIHFPEKLRVSLFLITE